MLAALYDIHANLPALEAVLADAEQTGADRFLLGGDYASLGAWPNETLTRLRELSNAKWIRGNWERWVAGIPDVPQDDFVQHAIRWCRDQLAEDTIAELAALPEQVVIDGARYCHGSPAGDMRSFAPVATDSDDELLAGVAEQRVVFGHTHVQFRRVTASGVELVNPGSVGLPFDGDVRAAYALVSDAGDVELRRVAYDHGASAAAVRERLAGWAASLARELEAARFDP